MRKEIFLYAMTDSMERFRELISQHQTDNREAVITWEIIPNVFIS